MTEKLLAEDIKERCEIFDENFADVTERIEKAASISGRKADEILLLAATKTIFSHYFSFFRILLMISHYITY